MTVPAFTLDLVADQGETLAKVDGQPLHAWTSWLRIRSDVTGFVPPSYSPADDELTGFVPPVFEDDGIAVLVHGRDHQDLDRRGVGLFHARLELAALEALHAAVTRISWAALPRPIGYDVHASQLRLRYACDRTLIDRSFNARSANFITALGPLWPMLEDIGARAMRGPSGTLEPGLVISADPEEPLRLTLRAELRNRSIGPVVLNDPRLRRPGDAARLELSIGPAVPGRDDLLPRQWTTLTVPALPDDAPEVVVLAARKRWSVELPWVAPAPGRYLARMRWSDYGGPVSPAPAQVPWMPVPETGLSFVGSGPYPVRGSCRDTVVIAV
ncbi:MAG: hypothetical protein KC431_18925 [Myxococcales bacterium]|nr:hypothetical protein [Myxococcales bacterium]